MAIFNSKLLVYQRVSHDFRWWNDGLGQIASQGARHVVVLVPDGDVISTVDEQAGVSIAAINGGLKKQTWGFNRV